MPRVFICYRRDDSGGYVNFLYKLLCQHFSPQEIFRDLRTIEPGEDFVEAIESAIGECEVLLAVIGRQWLTIADSHGNQRLEDPHDYVRLEIASALQRNIRVIPVLVGRASMPTANELPDDLKRLARRHAVELTDRHFETDVTELANAIRSALGKATETLPRAYIPPPPPTYNLPLLEWCFVPPGKVKIEGVTCEVGAFWISKYPVTYMQYEKFVNSDGYSNRAYWTNAGWAWKGDKCNPEIRWNSPKWHIDNHPVVGVNWYEALAFARWLSTKLGTQSLLLPTEAQWQRAAQGDDEREYPWGGHYDKKRCNTFESGIAKTTPVTHYSDGVSAFGVWDMSGNVWEWCLSKWNDHFVFPEDNDPEGEDLRIVRGGSWFNLHSFARTASRYRLSPYYGDVFQGFRLVWGLT
ncbi:MAG: SUMF1/EgtB/PvdO family nonheme iron enzyme [Chloroflexi bacterium]|nr:SUMF1/EgtB/PvdO family nonheme iron enzyme [Chloroflexota bacterium]